MGFTLLYTNPLCTAHSNTGWRQKQQPQHAFKEQLTNQNVWSCPLMRSIYSLVVVLRSNMAPKTVITHAHTHCSISQSFSTYDVFSPPPAVVAPPLTYDHMTEAATSKGHPTATGVVTCHHHCTNTHTVREAKRVSGGLGLIKHTHTHSA